MQLTNEIIVPVSRDATWAALNDPQVLQQCITGCDSITRIEDGEDGAPRYEITIGVSVGPVKAKFKGKLTIQDSVPPASYTILFEGNGGPNGHGKGDARVTLEVIEPELTLLRYAANVTVGGRIAQVGSRLVDMAAKKMATDFFRQFQEQLSALRARTQMSNG